MKTLIKIIPLLCLLSGCGATAEDYKYTPTSVLCAKLMTTPSGNINPINIDKAVPNTQPKKNINNIKYKDFLFIFI